MLNFFQFQNGLNKFVKRGVVSSFFSNVLPPEPKIRKQQVTVFGCTGQIGFQVSKSLAKLGHSVVAVSRARTKNNSAKLDELYELGCNLKETKGKRDYSTYKKFLKNTETCVFVERVTGEEIVPIQSVALKAALSAGVQCFVPTEFGSNNLVRERGIVDFLDLKKDFQDILKQSGINYKLIFTGGFFDYFLPNLRFFEKITTFGKMDTIYPTHDLRDIGAITARIISDPRVAKKGVQICSNLITQIQALNWLYEAFPNYKFERIHYDSETILKNLKTSGNEITAKGGHETDKERWQLNKMIWIDQQLYFKDERQTLKAHELYPNFEYIKPQDVLKDPIFVFGKKNY
ncbi:cipa-like [Anaeramoeba flamelloides]|uniref:Cipa-like n=1 Tax=Anaeramoeba flamelloides TaxID=1746091 RepID=A0ABQ8Y0Z6_9EUKA|nr:cipa-like [Anaeramoeba flamelloides]